ncbi:MAG TPA: hypothetical protein VFD59_04000 [Nocardioidaceae bacterium]|nr:hypothetical protein [Nocardioidaceae bacterium]
MSGSVPTTTTLVELPADLTVASFWERVGKLEHESLDFKERLPKDLGISLAAMAMTAGGLINDDPEELQRSKR